MYALFKNPDGKRILLYLDVLPAFIEGDKGQALAVTQSGATIELSETFDSIVDELTTEEDEEDEPDRMAS